MRCIRPLKAGYDVAGSLTFSNKLADQSVVGFEFECRKCLPCRLNIAREKAVRAYHESRMHEDSIFLTLTYDDDHLQSPRLMYPDFQAFMKRLREKVNRGLDKDHPSFKKIPVMVTGEYGDKTKRPHWHALIFNYRPNDLVHHYTTDYGDRVWTSTELTALWGNGHCEFGNITMDSASYVARYAAKKLTHGKDQEHDYHPIHKTSSRNAIGRSWIERYFKHTFENGFVVLPNGEKSKIPRYYVDWAKVHQFDIWKKYVTEVRPTLIKAAEKQARKEEIEFLSNTVTYKGGADFPLRRSLVNERILKQKFKRLQEHLKL